MSAPFDPIGTLQRTLGEGGTKLFDTVPFMLGDVIKGRWWAERTDKNGQLFASFEAFVTHKLWWGLESSIDDLMSYCRNYPDVQKLIRGEVAKAKTHEEAGALGGRGNKAVDNVKGFDEGGNASTYALRRLKRDNPELAEQVVAGALSAHAAAVQAGFRKPTWTAPADVERLAQAIERRFPAYRLIKVG